MAKHVIQNSLLANFLHEVHSEIRRTRCRGRVFVSTDSEILKRNKLRFVNLPTNGKLLNLSNRNHAFNYLFRKIPGRGCQKLVLLLARPFYFSGNFGGILRSGTIDRKMMFRSPLEIFEITVVRKPRRTL